VHRSYTAENAYGAFEEGEKGRIAVGFLADLVILDRDIRSVPAEEIRDAQVDLTMVDGQVVYER
jgi:predicted amidohydrolase YtcJ